MWCNCRLENVTRPHLECTGCRKTGLEQVLSVLTCEPGPWPEAEVSQGTQLQVQDSNLIMNGWVKPPVKEQNVVCTDNVKSRAST